jgi:hypothetical protein
MGATLPQGKEASIFHAGYIKTSLLNMTDGTRLKFIYLSSNHFAAE